MSVREEQKRKSGKTTDLADSAADLSTRLSSFSPRSRTDSMVLCCGQVDPRQSSALLRSLPAIRPTKMILVSSSSCCTFMMVSACFGSWYLTM